MHKNTRKKPFSGAQKKLQLKERNRRKRETRDDDEFESSPKQQPQGRQESEEDRATSESSTQSRASARLDSMFVKLAPKPIELRKVAAQQPLPNVDYSKEREVRHGDSSPTIDMPKRPRWSFEDTPEELEQRETAYFNQWLEDLQNAYPGDRLGFFERNLEVWRQLWRVLEISDIIVLLVDVRHPLFHFPKTLYDHAVRELKKPLVLILNKVDLVGRRTVVAWREYLLSMFPDIHIAEFSSRSTGSLGEDDPSPTIRMKKSKRSQRHAPIGVRELLQCCSGVRVRQRDGALVDWDEVILQCCKQEGMKETTESFFSKDNSEFESEDDDGALPPITKSDSYDNGALPPVTKSDSLLTIGLVGQPNVGKSSIVNSIIGTHRVSVSRTPGHTKHFQTLHITEHVRICDSPGVVFPALVLREMQVLLGVYNVAQVQEPYSVVAYLARFVNVVDILDLKPQDLFEDEDGVVPKGFEWSAWSICEALAFRRGFLTPRAGRPDVYRAANYLLRMVAEGQIIVSFKPPGFFTVQENS